CLIYAIMVFSSLNCRDKFWSLSILFVYWNLSMEGIMGDLEVWMVHLEYFTYRKLVYNLSKLNWNGYLHN
ncbi:MAG: hypothetical protein ACFFDF_22005, partial [Candidatus Odinarchaeota archaeon]